MSRPLGLIRCHDGSSGSCSKRSGQNHFIFLTTHYLEEAEEIASVIGILDQGQMKGVDNLDGLRRLLKFPYSIRVEASTEAERLLQDGGSGEILHRGSQLRVFTTEEEAMSPGAGVSNASSESLDGTSVS